MIFDIPVNFQVVSENEPRAEQQLFDFLMKSMKEFGIEQRVSDFEYFEFVAEAPSNTGCGNHDHKQGESAHCCKQTGACTEQGCC